MNFIDPFCLFDFAPGGGGKHACRHEGGPPLGAFGPVRVAVGDLRVEANMCACASLSVGFCGVRLCRRPLLFDVVLIVSFFSIAFQLHL